MANRGPLVATVAGAFVPSAGGAAAPGSLRWKEEILSTVSLFAGMSKRHRRSLARIANLLPFQLGDQLVTVGGVDDTLGVIVDGTVRVVKNGRTVARMSAGDFFGEVAVLDPGPRTASLVGESAGRCLTIEGKRLRRLMATEAGMASEIARVLARRLRETSLGPTS
jgi:CRP-like cAMP-binding protein